MTKRDRFRILIGLWISLLVSYWPVVRIMLKFQADRIKDGWVTPIQRETNSNVRRKTSIVKMHTWNMYCIKVNAYQKRPKQIKRKNLKCVWPAINDEGRKTLTIIHVLSHTQTDRHKVSKLFLLTEHIVSRWVINSDIVYVAFVCELRCLFSSFFAGLLPPHLKKKNKNVMLWCLENE